jgi:hypothetical protein
MSRPKRAGLLSIVALFTLFGGAALLPWPAALEDHACCHVSAQDPGQDEEGNPGHMRPQHKCNHKPAGNQVSCHCQTDCNKDGSQREDTRCRSYCYKEMCSCPRRPCP